MIEIDPANPDAPIDTLDGPQVGTCTGVGTAKLHDENRVFLRLNTQNLLDDAEYQLGVVEACWTPEQARRIGMALLRAADIGAQTWPAPRRAP